MRARTRPLPVAPPLQPMVVAHRGASSVAPEHTLAAYVEAIDSGADGVECDVRLTRDGHLVCVHDRTVNRTSNGRGTVSDLDLASLRELDFASWYRELPTCADELVEESGYLSGVEPDRADDGKVLTLERLLELVHDASRPVRLLIETKHPTRYGGLVEKELVELLARFGWAGRPGPPPTMREPADMHNRVIVMSFAATALRRVKLLAPDVPTVLLMMRYVPGLRNGSLPAGSPIAGPSLSILRADPGYVDRAHARGNRVFVWVVNEPDDLGFVRGLGVDSVISDRPSDALAVLKTAGRFR